MQLNLILYRIVTTLGLLAAAGYLVLQSTGCDFEPQAALHTSYTCECSCDIGSDPMSQMSVAFPVCRAFDRDSSYFENSEEANQDCKGRVQSTFVSLANSCVQAESCQCHAVADSLRDNDSCEEFKFTHDTDDVFQCQPRQLVKPLTECRIATHTLGERPICLTEERPLGDAFNDLTLCSVSGSAEVEVDGEKETPGVVGTLSLLGQPCPPGQSCPVGVAYDLDIDSMTFDDGIGGAQFSNVHSTGTSAPAALTLNANGRVTVPPNAMVIQGQADVRISSPLGDERGVAAVEDTNDEAFDIRLDQSAQLCEFQGNLQGKRLALEANNPLGKDSASLNMKVNLRGDILNTPPQVDSGPNQVVECSSPEGSPITLQADITDSEQNVVAIHWFEDDLNGTKLGTGETLTVTQDIETQQSQTYMVQVVDAFMQSATDTVTVKIEDTQAPMAQGGWLAQPDVLTTVTGKLVDVEVLADGVVEDCSRQWRCELISIVSSEPEMGPGDETGPDWEITGDLTARLRAERQPEGSGRVYELTVQCQDAHNNVSAETVTVHVP